MAATGGSLSVTGVADTLRTNVAGTQAVDRLAVAVETRKLPIGGNVDHRLELPAVLDDRVDRGPAADRVDVHGAVAGEGGVLGHVPEPGQAPLRPRAGVRRLDAGQATRPATGGGPR